jgi:hypothetical protein
MVVLHAFTAIVEAAAEAAHFFQVDQRHGDLDDAQPEMSRLHP